VCVELDGQAAHPAEGRWRDTHRDNANLLQGTQTLRYGWPDVTRAPLPDRGRDSRSPAPPRLDRDAPALWPGLHGWPPWRSWC